MKRFLLWILFDNFFFICLTSHSASDVPAAVAGIKHTNARTWALIIAQRYFLTIMNKKKIHLNMQMQTKHYNMFNTYIA